MKKALVFLLSAVLTLGTVSPVLADNGNGEYTPENGYEAVAVYNNGEEAEAVDAEVEAEGQAEQLALPPAIGVTGYITAYDNNQLTVVSQFNEDDVIVLNLTEATVIIDAETGSPAVIADRISDRVKVYHSPVTTRSIPPQSAAFVVAVNLPEYASSPHYQVIEAIEQVDENTLRLLVDNGGLYITLDRDTPLFPHLTRQHIALEHLQVGDTLLFWYEVVAMSFPGQTTATRALWLSAADVEDSEIEAVDTEEATDIEVVDTEVAPEPTDEDIAVEPPVNVAVPGTGIMRDGVEFFPVRALAVDAGFTVTWESATRSAILTADGVSISVADKATTFYIDGVAYSLPVAVVIENGVMYAPYSFFYHFS
jgi:hypothetical protein